MMDWIVNNIPAPVAGILIFTLFLFILPIAIRLIEWWFAFWGFNAL
jgi:hypothetical protein